MITVAVIGGGAVGGLFAAVALGCGHDTVLCVRTPFPALEITVAGAARTVPVRIATDPAQERPVDWVMLATKAHDTAGAAPWLERLIGPGTIVAALQNGVDHEERMRPFAGDAEIMPALTYTAVERTGPGRITHHSGSKVFVPEGPAGAAFAGLLAGSGIEVVQEADFLTTCWRKMLANSAANPITTLTLRRIGVMREPRIRELAHGLFRETLAVGVAAGAQLTEGDFDAMVERYDTLNPVSGSSMLYDRLAGRPLEYDALTGAVVRMAERHGIPVPLNRAMLALLEALDQAPRPSGDREGPSPRLGG
ncbi:MAG TPA: 2-dehydropantoate 2-reductase [Alphaproteobacteria bacterium]|nr:2-dehydropantoate 2-reductase [Alphaproteobacteria bacterium]